MLDVDLSDRVVLVTGSARGLGRATALACADAGGAVAVHYHTSAEAAEHTAAEITADGGRAATVQADVTDPDDVEGLFETVEAELGSVDVLVNNVGAFAPRHWSDLEHADWERVLETNLYGTYLCSQRALGPMRDAGWGRIVNVGYASAEKAMVSPGNFPYFVAKTGVLMFTRMLAADTQDDGITVNAVSPYVIENSDEFPEELPRGRPAAYEDVLQAMACFLHADSDYISGENLEVDGGWLPERV